MQTQTQNAKGRTWYFFVFVLLFIVIFPAAIFYSLGYRVTKDLRIVATGGITLHEVPDGAQVYLDYQEADTPNILRRSFFVPDLLPGSYLVVVAKEGSWSWAKRLEVKEKAVTSASVFLLPQKIGVEPIKEYELRGEEKGGFLFFTQSTSTEKVLNPLFVKVRDLFQRPITNIESVGFIYPATSTMSSGNITVFRTKSLQVLVAQWEAATSTASEIFCRESCVKSFPFFLGTEKDPIVSFAFFPRRDDIIILARKSGLYVIEIDARGEQNVQPLYLGTGIDYRIDGNKVYLNDAGRYFEIRL